MGAETASTYGVRSTPDKVSIEVCDVYKLCKTSIVLKVKNAAEKTEKQQEQRPSELVLNSQNTAIVLTVGPLGFGRMVVA